ncbi:MAG: hypothetical protein HY763_10110 [Planctomycetes bacterium]|nr:hypothetical protein [Planctomycetota bacterium]
MTRRYQPIDAARLRTYSIRQRRHKAASPAAALLPEAGASASDLIASLPRYLGAEAFRQVVAAIVAAVRNDRPVVAAFGAHVIKVGCGPILVDLMRRGVIKAVAANGACAIHDVELALFGETSEEVADTIRDGSFGMVAETLEFFDAAAALAQRHAIGLGAAVGRLLVERRAPHLGQSVFATAWEHLLPACVHVALGTDTVHVSAGADGAAWGAASLLDFRLVCDVVRDLGAVGASSVGGVWLNVGSAVLLPEVFLKAVSVARNLGANLDCMTTANFDMIRHYRPRQNVIGRPVSPGRGHDIAGHHEIMLPLLRCAVLEALAGT